MPFLRFSRDKRGVENFFLVQPTTNRRGKVRPRVLYWFRSPPDIKVGRQPFDPAVRRALEAQNPDITFDWRAIVETPIPSADADKWRERRRAERAAKHAAARDDIAEQNAEAETTLAGDAAEDADALAAATEDAGDAEPPPVSTVAVAAASADGSPAASGFSRTPNKRRRRRRGGAGRSGPPSPATPGSSPGGDASGD